MHELLLYINFIQVSCNFSIVLLIGDTVTCGGGGGGQENRQQEAGGVREMGEKSKNEKS